MIGKLGPMELGVILLLAVLFFGPSIIRRLKQSVREARNLSNE